MPFGCDFLKRILVCADEVQVTGDEKMLHIGGNAVTDVGASEWLPVMGFESGFFAEFAFGCGQHICLALGRTASYNFVRVAPQGITPLSDNRNFLVIIEGKNSDRGPNFHDAINARATIGPDYLVFADSQPRILIGDFGLERLPGIPLHAPIVTCECKLLDNNGVILMSSSTQTAETRQTETGRIADQIRRAYKGPAWHGPSLRAILLDVTEERAQVHPANGAHSIREIVLHITAWMRIARERLTATEVHAVTDDEDWPASNASWSEILAELASEEKAFYEAVLKFPDEQLNERAPAVEPQSYYTLLHGVVQHITYHAGQIIFLNK